MSSDFSESFRGPIKNVTIYVAEFGLDQAGYREGPRMLSRTISFSLDRDKSESVTYYGDGTVHSREVITLEARSRKSILERFKRDGELRDTWHIYYDQQGRRTRAEAYGPDGQFRGEFPVEDDEPVEPFELGETVMDSGESAEREMDAHGNWTHEIRFREVIENGKVEKVPTRATYRTITYFAS